MSITETLGTGGEKNMTAWKCGLAREQNRERCRNGNEAGEELQGHGEPGDAS